MPINEQKLAFGPDGQVQYALDGELVSDINFKRNSGGGWIEVGGGTAKMYDNGDFDGVRYRLSGKSFADRDSATIHLGDLDGNGFNVDIIADGTNCIWIDGATSFVGINTVTPANSLDVVGAINSDTKYKVGGQSFVKPIAGQIQLGDVDTVGGVSVNIISAGLTSIWADGSSGFVGIANPTPAYRLDVAGDINANSGYHIGGFLIASYSPGSVFLGDAGNLGATDVSINAGGAASIYMLGTNGHVGILNTTPAYALDVTGDINVTGAVRVNGIPVGTTPPAGANKNVQFNDGGVFGGSSGFKWDKVANQLALVATTGSGVLQIQSNANSDAIHISDNSTSSLLFSIVNVPYPGSRILSDGALILGDVDTNLVFLKTSKVGILNSAPAYLLDVSGDINTTGVFRKGGTAGVSGTFLAPTSITVAGGIITAIS